MPTEIQQFGAFLKEHTDTFILDFMAQLEQLGPTYQREDPQNLRSQASSSFFALADSIQKNDIEGLALYCQNASQQRVSAGYTIEELLQAIQVLRNLVLGQLDLFLQDHQPWTPKQVCHLEDFLHTFNGNFLVAFGDQFKRMQENITRMEEELDSQMRTIRELGTPILPVHEGIIVLPIVGMLDSSRANQVMENLLVAITDFQADMVIMDITGVPVVDTSVANYLLQTTRAVNLVGAHVILVGIGSEIAQTMVQLGVDLSTITTLANLQEGLQYAFNELGFTIS